MGGYSSRILGCRCFNCHQPPAVVHCTPPLSSLPIDALRHLPWQLQRRVIFLGAISSSSVCHASSGCPLRSRFPLHHRLMDLHTPADPASPAMRDLAVDLSDRAAAFLHLAGTTAVSVVGSLADAPRIGGIDETRGDLQGSS